MTQVRRSAGWVAAGAALALAACGGSGEFEVRMAWGPLGPPTEPRATLFGDVVEIASDEDGLEGARVLAQSDPVRVADVLAGAAEVRFAAVPNGGRRVVVVEVRDGASRGAELLRSGVSAPFALEEGRRVVVEVTAGLLPPPGAGPGAAVGVEGFAPSERVTLASPRARLLLTTDAGARAEISGFPTFPVDRTLCAGLGAPAAGCDGYERRGVAERRGPDGCVRAAGTASPCTYAVDWDVSTGLDDDCGLDPARGFPRSDACPRPVFVRFFDDRGVGSRVYPLDVVLDTRPPSVTRSETDYLPLPGNPLDLLGAAGPGASIRIDIALSEPVRAPETAWAASPEGGRIAFARAAEGGSDLVYTATLASPLPPSGAYTLELPLEDRAGNRAEVGAAVGLVQVWSAPPTLLVDQRRLSYLRAPVTRAGPEALGRFTLPEGPYFALGPADPLDDAPALAGDVLRLADGPAAALRVWADDRREVLLVPLVRPDPDGTWPRTALQLPALDVPRVYLTGLDAAGNESPPVLVESVWYVGTTAPARSGASPHRLSRPRLSAYPRGDASPIPLGELTGTPDGRTIREGPELTRRALRGADVGPLPGAAVWDETRGETVFTEHLDRTATLAWDGLGFADRTPGLGNPVGRAMTAVAFDRARGRVVAYPSNRAETWTWDGASWSQVPTSTTPPARSEAALAFDSAREQVVLAGGLAADGTVLSDTWTFDGRDWTRRSRRGPPRAGHALAYDPRSRSVLLFGGREAPGDGGGPLAPAETWAWDGAAWSDVTPSGPSPAPRVGPILAHDPTRDRVVLSGGRDARGQPVGDTWEWDGARWTQMAASGAPAVGVGAFDGRLGRVVAWGGLDLDEATAAPKLRSWDGAAWSVRSGGPWPPGVAATLLTYDPGRAVARAFAPPLTRGEPWQVWTLDGSAWTRQASPGPELEGEPDDLSYPFQVAAAHDAGQGRTVVVHFRGGGLDTWTYDGNQLVRTSTRGPDLDLATVVYDAARSEVLLFGGDELFAWTGTAWQTKPTVGPRPPARWRELLGYDPRRQRVVLIGGVRDTPGGGFARVDDQWEWNGTHWQEIVPSSGAPRFEPWDGAQLFYDDALERLMLVKMYEGGAWGWNGVDWQTFDIRARFGDLARMVYLTARRAALLVSANFESDPNPMRGPLVVERLEPAPPALQLRAVLPPDLPLAAVAEIHVRGACGGTSGDGPGARLVGWRRGPATSGWELLDANGAPVDLSRARPDEAALDYRTPAPDVARRMVLEADRAVYLQCRADTDAGADTSEVALDYLEARVRYALTPRTP